MARRQGVGLCPRPPGIAVPHRCGKPRRRARADAADAGNGAADRPAARRERRPGGAERSGAELRIWSELLAGTRWFFRNRSEEHTSELQSLMRISYAVFCLKKKKQK